MVNLDKFQQDLKNGLTLEETLLKHKTTLKDVFKKSLDYSIPTKSKKTKHVQKVPAGGYIQFRAGKYQVRKHLNGTQKSFGTYRSSEDAITVRDYLMEHGWIQTSVDSICEKFGIDRVKPQRNTVRYH